jgi:glutaredoxin
LRKGRDKRAYMSEKEIKVYSVSTCSHCKATKKLLNEYKVAYDYVDVDMREGEDREAILEEMKRFNPKCSFPTSIIGEQVIVGFRESEIKEALKVMNSED